MRGTHWLRGTLIGDRVFYSRVARIIFPYIAQMLITNLILLLNNIMVGSLGTEALSGVTVAGQLVFVFNLCIFGGLAGPGIFCAQFFGADDQEGVRGSFRLKIWICLFLLLITFVALLGFGEPLMRGYLTGEGSPEEARRMLRHGLDYLHVMLIGFAPFALSSVYSGTLREAGESLLPMKAGIAAVLANLLFNWLLVYGKLGLPRMGVRGSAAATVISRFVELYILVHAMHRSGRFEFMHGLYRTLRVPLRMAAVMLRRGLPLLINEFFWAFGMATLMQIYSLRGLNVLAAFNIGQSINNMFTVFFLSIGNAIAAMVGQSLGAGDMERARADVWRFMALNFFGCALVALLMALPAGFFPTLFNTGEDVRGLARALIITMACYMPVYAVSHCSYFTLRSGGSTILTFVFDSVYMWAIAIPFTLALVHWTDMPMRYLYPVSEAANIIRMFVGLYMVRKGVWIRNLVADHAPAPAAEG